MLLAIDTSTKHAGLLLWNSGVIASTSWYSKYNHTKHVIAELDKLISENNFLVSDIKAIALAIGPGSFSALRVGFSIAKGLCVALKIPLTGISTLLAEAYSYRGTSQPICPLIFVNQRTIALGHFVIDKSNYITTIQPETIVPADKLPQFLPKGSMVCGEGTQTLKSMIDNVSISEITIVEYCNPYRRLESLAQLGSSQLDAGFDDDPETLQPRYLREPNITKPNPAKLIKLGKSQKELM